MSKKDTTFLDLSRVSYATTVKLSKKKSAVEVGFTDLESAQQFHQFVVDRSKQHQRMTPLARAEIQAREFVDGLARENWHVAPELRSAIEQRFVKLIAERNEQGRNAIELFDEVKRLQGLLAAREPA
jgi:hypothetical protein